jgi:hypothetical protein
MFSVPLDVLMGRSLGQPGRPAVAVRSAGGLARGEPGRAIRGQRIVVAPRQFAERTPNSNPTPRRCSSTRIRRGARA